ncbi:MAG: hypothetical protein FRX49_02404 [Trebouxia sp. A1-2]|nr:MAG: hypothetical protein FRX49_02404 [Trebouxia sp. A1-2]
MGFSKVGVLGQNGKHHQRRQQVASLYVCMQEYLQDFSEEAHVLIQESEAGAEAMHSAQHQSMSNHVTGDADTCIWIRVNTEKGELRLVQGRREWVGGGRRDFALSWMGEEKGEGGWKGATKLSADFLPYSKSTSAAKAKSKGKVKGQADRTTMV